MNTKRIIALVLIVVYSTGFGLLRAQTKTVEMSDRYGILTVTPLDRYTGTAPLLKTNGVRSLTDVSYGDGFGGIAQKIHIGVTPQGKDLAESYEYHPLGHLQSCTLPVPLSSGGAFGNYRQISKLAQMYYGDDNVCSSFTYEASHRNLLLEESGPGGEWTGKAASRTYGCNLKSIPARRCKHYQVSDEGDLTENDSLYADGSLRGISFEDADGNVHWEFYNSENKLLLSRTVGDGDVFLDTYYVYDLFDNLAYVLTPAYQDNPDPELYAYVYRHDYLDRLVYKKLPGCAPVYMVYDNLHRLVFSQDGRQRSDSLWSFFLYDDYGRVVVEGECSNSDANVESASWTSVLTTLSEGDTGLAGSGYQSSFELVSPDVYVVNYYDTYDFRTRSCFAAYDFPAGSVSAVGSRTGSMFRQYGTPDFICSADYYDAERRIVKSISTHADGGRDVYDTGYTFRGNPQSVCHTHTDSSGYTLTEHYTYTYDHSERLLRLTHQYGSNPSVVLVEHAYDELGRLQTDKLHDGVYTTDYAYNIRDWLTDIDGSKFSQALYYTDGAGTPCYNGNISSMTWRSGSGSVDKGYTFSYDGLSRLTDAVYGEGASLADNPNRYNEQVTGYDKLGNILGLKRYGKSADGGYGLIDNLSMTYEGSQLQSVSDCADTSAYGDGFEFKDGADLTVEYRYDANGNLTQDLNKKILEIQYNCLNLPSRITFENGNRISYLYAANGAKLRTTHVIGNDTTVTDYCGNVVYENGTPKMLLTEVGYVSLDDNKYHYYIRDHQGNNRVVMAQDGTVEEVNDYYPFGGLMATSSANSVQPYKYNGKELDRKGGLDWYDYGARMYDAALGRWHVVDPMSEKYYAWSPYAYCLNNPILLIDSNGMWPTWNGLKNSVNRALSTGASFFNGAVRAVADNLLLGGTNLRETGIYSSATAYNIGQDVGDAVSILIGGAEITTGLGEVAGGMVASPETAGASLAVSAKGVADITHGSLTATSGAQKLFSRKGRVSESDNNGNGYAKSSGKNEKHSNFKAREAAKEKMMAAQERLEDLKKSNLNATNEEINNIKREIKHWKKKMDDAGETHHRR